MSSMPFLPGGSGQGTIPMPGSAGSNQWGGPYPILTPAQFYGPSAGSGQGTTPPGIVPPASSIGPPSGAPGTILSEGPGFMGGPGTYSKEGGGQIAVHPIDTLLTNQLFQMLQGQIGQGVTPFNLSSLLPTGGTTGPGALTPGLDPISQALMQFYGGGSSNLPGANQLAQMAQTGDPISALPEWQAMVQAMQQQIGTGAANVREQEAFTGNLPGSGGALATSEYQNQATLDLNSLLGQLQTGALESAAGRQLTAGTTLQSGAQQLAPYLQGLDQQSIQNLYNEFIRTQPQYNPLLSEEFSASTTFPPTFGKAASPGIIGSLLPGVAGGISSGLSAAGSGSGLLASILAGLGGI